MYYIRVKKTVVHKEELWEMCQFISSTPQSFFFPFFSYFVVVVVKWEEPVVGFQAHNIFTSYVEQLVALGYVE